MSHLPAGPDGVFCTCGVRRTTVCPAEESRAPSKTDRQRQVAGDHYAKYAIQPWDIIDCYGLNYYEGTALKYLLRYRDKNGVEDLKKAQHFIDVLITKYGSKDD